MFYETLKGGAAADYPAKLQASLDEIAQQADNFRSYTAEGDHHCVLKTTKFYSEKTNGVLIRDWVADIAHQRRVETVR